MLRVMSKYVFGYFAILILRKYLKSGELEFEERERERIGGRRLPRGIPMRRRRRESSSKRQKYLKKWCMSVT